MPKRNETTAVEYLKNANKKHPKMARYVDFNVFLRYLLSERLH